MAQLPTTLALEPVIVSADSAKIGLHGGPAVGVLEGVVDIGAGGRCSTGREVAVPVSDLDVAP